MKTTIEIPDTTFRRAKSLAGSQGITLKQLFTQAIEERIRQKSGGGCSAQPAWVKLGGAFGKTPAARAETRRIQRLIDGEFEAIEPEGGE
jgi:hypothetical protein